MSLKCGCTLNYSKLSYSILFGLKVFANLEWWGFMWALVQFFDAITLTSN